MIRNIEINGKKYKLIGEGSGNGSGEYTLTEEDLKEIADKVKFSTVVEGRISDGIGGKDYDLEIGTEYKFIPNVLETNIFVLFGGKYMDLIRRQDTEPFTLKVIGSENKTVTYEYNGELLTKDFSRYSDLGATYASALFAYNFRGTIYRAMGDGKTPEKGIDYFTPEDVEKIVNEVAESVTTARTGTVTISADKWTGTSSPYAQVVTVEGVTKKSQVDLTPSDAQLAIFHEKDLAFVTSNYRGVVTVSAIGQKPMNDYEMQVTITEVEHTDENSPIIGVTVGTPISPSKIAEKTIEIIDGVPDYVKSEAESVIDRVLSAQGNRTFTFAVMTDMHYGNGSYTDGIKHACQAMKYIDERVKLDTIAILGDYTDGYPASAYANAISDFKDINKILDTLRFGQNLRIQGNHDYYEGHKGEINRFIASYSEGVTWGDITGGYFYKDFDGYKIRVICVNTTEAGGGDIGVSTEQYNWFANSLDLSSKEDSTEWQILIISHHPLDWWSNSYVFAYILDAYKKGTTWSDETISVDFTDKNSATLIGNIHGHIHNFLTDYIHLGNVNSGDKSDILRMATPNACYGRENQYTESVVGVNTWVEDTTYAKTKDSATDTAFCVYVVNLEACTITAICYGAGYDRNNIEYLSEAPIVNIIDTVGYTDTKRLSATSGEVRDDAENNFVTGYIELGNIGDVYRTSGTDFRKATNGYSCMCVYESNKAFSSAMTYFENDSSLAGIGYTIDENGNLTLTLNSGFERSGGFIRLCGNGSGANLLVTKNQPIG